MTSFNSIKNSFLFGFFLCTILFLPNLVNAKVDVAGDTKGYLDDNGNGSFYIADKKNNVGGYLDETVKFTEGIPVVGGLNSITYGSANWVLNKVGVGVDDAVFTLFNDNPSNPKITDAEFSALKEKLKADKSPLADKIKIGNVYRENATNVSTFVYKPNKDNDEDSKNIAYATKKTADGKGGNFYTVMKPQDKESTEANEQLNIIDKVQGRPEGTTITKKNEWYNAIKNKDKLQEKVNAAEKEVKAAEAALEAALKKSGNKETEEVDAARKALQTAKEKRDTDVNVNNQNQQVINTNQQKANNANQPVVLENTCGWNNLSSCFLWVGATAANVVFKLTSFLAYVVGTLFDYSLELTINSAEFLKKLGVVEITWTFIRDILNMTFIFILLFTAIQILIGNDAKYNARKILTNVIIFAILMNFSLFAAKLMVDGSNIVSLKIYEAMKSSTSDKDSSISLRVMNTVGLVGLYDVTKIFTAETLQAEGTCANNPMSLITVSVLGSIFLIILILALGLASILFLLRLVNIIFLFIRSPLWIWGYAVPGSSTMSKISSTWWSEMQHVLLFPIMYLFQILIAIIVFDKLGSIQKDGTSLLDLICNPPTEASGFGNNISLVLVFVIVIMFLMRAISYGVKNVSGGGEGAIGNKMGTNIANKFAGAQTWMTKGLANKAGGIAAAGTIGVTKVPLRAFAGGLNGIRKREDGILKGVKDGYSNPSINLKEFVGNQARDHALNSGWIGNTLDAIPGIRLNQRLAALAKKYEDPTNTRGETKKKADARRTQSTVNHTENIKAAVAKKYKIPTQAEYEKKKGSKITTDGDVAEFQAHIEDLMKKITDNTVGRIVGQGVLGKTDTRDAGVNGSGPRSHLEILKGKMFTGSEDIKDAAGNVIGKKVKINEAALPESLISILEHNTTGTGVAEQNKAKYQTRKAQAKIKTTTSGLIKDRQGALTKDSAKKNIETLEKTIAKMQTIQDVTSKKELEKLIGDGLPGNAKLYTGDGDNNETIKKFNLKIKELQDQIAHNPAATAQIQILMDNAKKTIEAHQDFLDTHNEKMVKKRNELVKALKAQEEADKK